MTETTTWQGTANGGWRPADEETAAYRALDDAGEPSADLAYWIARVSDRLPGADAGTVFTLACHLQHAATVDSTFWTSSDNGPLANALADLGDVDGLTRHARLADMVPGSVDALKALHAWVKADQDSPAAPSPAPDPFDGQRHTVVRKRTKKGTTSKRTRAGVAQVQGDWERPRWMDNMTPADRRTLRTRIGRSDATSRTIALWALQYRPRPVPTQRRTYGTNVIEVNRESWRRYGPAVDHRPVNGTDITSYPEMIDPEGSTVDVYRVAIHADDIGGFASTPALRAAIREHAWKRPEESTVGWDLRTTVVGKHDSYPKARKSEMASSTRLIAPGPDYPTTVFVGHGPAIPRGIKAGDHIKDTRTVDAVDFTPDPQQLPIHAGNLAPAERLALTLGPWHGAITLSAKGRWSMSIRTDDGRSVAVKGLRTLEGVLAKLPA